jgi:hypothetical protein
MARGPVRIDLAAALGRQPNSSATRSTRSRVAAETPGRPLSAYETTAIETPAARATSVIVGRRAGGAAEAGEDGPDDGVDSGAEGPGTPESYAGVTTIT